MAPKVADISARLDAIEKSVTDNLDSFKATLEKHAADSRTSQNTGIAELRKEMQTMHNELLNRIKLLEKRIDANQQYSRRQTVRLNRLEFNENNEKPIEDQVLDVFNDGQIQMQKSDLNRVHYSGKPITNQVTGKTTRQVIVQFRNWGARHRAHKYNNKNRRKPTRIHADLTKHRYGLLNKARDTIKGVLDGRFTSEQQKQLPFGQKFFAFANENSELRIQCGRKVLQFDCEETLEKAMEEVRAAVATTRAPVMQR